MPRIGFSVEICRRNLSFESVVGARVGISQYSFLAIAVRWAIPAGQRRAPSETPDPQKARRIKFCKK